MLLKLVTKPLFTKQKHWIITVLCPHKYQLYSSAVCPSCSFAQTTCLSPDCKAGLHGLVSFHFKNTPRKKPSKIRNKNPRLEKRTSKNNQSPHFTFTIKFLYTRNIDTVFLTVYFLKMRFFERVVSKCAGAYNGCFDLTGELKAYARFLHENKRKCPLWDRLIDRSMCSLWDLFVYCQLVCCYCFGLCIVIVSLEYFQY